MILVVACAHSVNVHAEQSSFAHFGRYRTFAFESAPGAPAEFQPGPQSGYVELRVEQIAKEVMLAKGYVPLAGGRADLLIIVSAGRRERWTRVPNPDAPRFDRRGATQQEDVLEGAVAVDAFDDATGERVWSGTARVTGIGQETVDEARLQHAVSAVLATFPAR